MNNDLKNQYNQRLIEEMELLYQLLEEVNDAVQTDSIVKMLAELVKFVDTNKIA